jgi:hypothetical protein
MYTLRVIKLCVKVSKLLLLSIVIGGSAVAAPVIASYDFTGTPESPIGTGAGNEWVFSDQNGSAQTATVTTWADVGADELEAATLHQVADARSEGLGSCNSLETNCLAKDNIRAITESTGKDWILVMFSEAVNLTDFTLAPDLGTKKNAQSQFIDTTFFTGYLGDSSDLLGVSYADLTSVLGLTSYTADGYGKMAVPETININTVAGGEVWGNAILIGGSTDVTSGAERSLLQGMTTVVPVPPAIWLFFSALGALAGLRRTSK